jgi:hypothetical protein
MIVSGDGFAAEIAHQLATVAARNFVAAVLEIKRSICKQTHSKI